MRLELTGRHVDITPASGASSTPSSAKLERLLNDSAVSAQVVLTREKHRHRADITLHARGEKFLHGVGDADSWEPSLTPAIDKIAQQAQKVKGKWQERKRRGASGARPRRSARGAAAAAPRPRAGARARADAARSCAPSRQTHQADVGRPTPPARSTPTATASSSSATPRRRRSASSIGARTAS